MKNIKWIFKVLLFFISIEEIRACMCGGDTNIETYSLETYDEIFLGELISTEYSSEISINKAVAFPAEIDKFRILKSWKGTLNTNSKTLIYQFGIGCTNSLVEKKIKSKFIIGAYHSKEFPSEYKGIEKFLQTGLCDLIIQESDEKDYEKAIRILSLKYKKPIDKKYNYITFGLTTLSILFLIMAIKLKNKSNLQ